jgi:hypothetical protein
MAIRNGIAPIDELAVVGDYALENMEYVLTDRRPNLDDVVAFFVGYGSRYICVELSEDPGRAAGWLWAESSLAPCDDVWQEVDGWMVEFTDW